VTRATAHGVARKPNAEAGAEVVDDDDDEDLDDGDDADDEDGDDDDAGDDNDDDKGDDEDAAAEVRNASNASRSVIQSATAVRSNGGGAASSKARSRPVVLRAQTRKNMRERNKHSKIQRK
jgi:hypothetical protein